MMYYLNLKLALYVFFLWKLTPNFLWKLIQCTIEDYV